MKKIQIFIPGSVGGAERVCVTIGKILIHAGFDVVFCIENRGSTPIEQFIPSGINKNYYPHKRHSISHLFKMVKLIRQEQPDVVFAPCRYLSRDVILAAKMASTGCKIIVRSDNPLKTLDGKGRLFVKKIFPFADIVIAQQEEMRQELINDIPLPPEKVVTIQNPIDTETINEKAKAGSPYNNKDEVRYVWVAGVRESGTKGHDILLKAFQIVKKNIPQAHLYFVGKYLEEGKYYLSLKKYVEVNGLTDSVHFVGYDENPYRWVKHADCFVLPSRMEGLPNAMVEAMYLGKPVVATRCLPIIDRMVEDGVNGYKVEVEDYENMAVTMARALELKNAQMIYQPSSNEKIEDLFNSVSKWKR